MDVADAAGVSIKTVSRVFNGEPNVRAATAQRVHEAADRLSYSPNLSARRLASNRSYLIGLVYDNPAGTNSFIPDVQDGVLRACRQANYELVIHPADADAADADQQLIALSQKLHLDGLILMPPFSDKSDLLETLNARDLMVSRISQSFLKQYKPCVSVDDEASAHRVTEYLIELGHRRIAFIEGNPAHGCTPDRRRGYESAMAAHGIALTPDWICPGDFSFQAGYKAGQALLGQAETPSAIFASNDDMAAGALAAAHELGISVPSQLSICGYDDVSIASQTWPPLTTVRQPIKAIAQAAARKLFQRLSGRHDDDPSLFHSELIVRGSTAAPAG